MLSVERIQELLNDPDISGEEAKEIRNEFCLLAEMIFEQWCKKNKAQ